jgi:hypothetical protein
METTTCMLYIVPTSGEAQRCHQQSVAAQLAHKIHRQVHFAHSCAPTNHNNPFGAN